MAFGDFGSDGSGITDDEKIAFDEVEEMALGVGNAPTVENFTTFPFIRNTDDGHIFSIVDGVVTDVTKITDPIKTWHGTITADGQTELIAGGIKSIISVVISGVEMMNENEFEKGVDKVIITWNTLKVDDKYKIIGT